MQVSAEEERASALLPHFLKVTSACNKVICKAVSGRAVSVTVMVTYGDDHTWRILLIGSTLYRASDPSVTAAEQTQHTAETVPLQNQM